MGQKRIIIIGLDGVPFGLLKDLAERGIMPNTRAIISQGIFRSMQSSIPEVSSVAWSSIITGKNPAEHAIFGFTELRPNSYELRFPNFSDLQADPFWNLVQGKSIVFNVPSTYPVKEMNGVHISGFVSVDLSKSIFPKTLLPTFEKMNYRLDVDSTLAHKSMDLFLSDLDKTLQARIQAYRYLWSNHSWRIFMFVFTSTDRLMHFLWDAYEDEKHIYHRDFVDHFQKIDTVIGEVFSRTSDHDLFMMFSDHGFEGLKYEVYINYLLRKEGFLTLQNEKEPEFTDITSSTKAFALDPARIYVNLKGSYPRGGVNLADKDTILQDLIALFSSLKIDNKKVINHVYRKEDVYWGPFMGSAPDLVLVGNSGCNLRARINANTLTDKGIFTGKHTQSDAFLLVNGLTNKDAIPDPPTVFDVKGLITA